MRKPAAGTARCGFLTIGVTGHRVITDVEKISAGIDAALDCIESAYPGRQLRVLSALAEGADRIVAQQVLARPGSALEVVLPLPVDAYVTDFTTPTSRDEFESLLRRADRVVVLPATPTREAAYDQANRYVLGACDVLLAVWDGADAQGQGGSGAAVAEARRRGLPVAWVHAGNRRPGTTEPTSLGPEQGTLTFERF